MRYYIYVIEHLSSGKKYVGYTHNPEKRWEEHQISSRRKRCSGHLHRALATYGIDAFSFTVIEECETLELAQNLEIQTIAALSTYGTGGYNMTKGGDGCRIMRHSDETRRKISEAKRGRPLSEEHKKKLGDVGRGRRHTLETRKLMSIRRKQGLEKRGGRLSDEHRQKLRDAWVIRRQKNEASKKEN